MTWGTYTDKHFIFKQNESPQVVHLKYKNLYFETWLCVLLNLLAFLIIVCFIWILCRAPTGNSNLNSSLIMYALLFHTKISAAFSIISTSKQHTYVYYAWISLMIIIFLTSTVCISSRYILLWINKYICLMLLCK